jgi:cold shock CspA family protein
LFYPGTNGNEYFAHRSAFVAVLFDIAARVGQKVTFEVGRGPKGPRAEQVRVA